ncbi:MAG: hypothetical protein A3J28_14975 [Acidobacteria bacterium RIFCSPLOWO2_12_FULL_60_22]|nr:MAG: hypothetical protein A3J28_14975 [Acidobacteria bacterium RIFCSPLOWO2_12_FULL_60_22]
MPNLHKADLIKSLRNRFGELKKITGSESLFAVGQDAARIYVRYSRLHPRGRSFFGLRDVDLKLLEGHNSFLCFLLGDGSPPLFVPYAAFEEVFHNAEPARDGQYKVQIISEQSGRELYVARQGRFNVEAYVGMELLERSLDKSLLKEAHDLSHPQVQTLLAGIGHIKGFDVYIPDNDIGSLDWSLVERFALRAAIPAGYEGVQSILSEIDVLWIARGRERLEGLFEVEHSTAIYSGLLRFNDIFLTDPKVSRFTIVSDEVRRAAFARQLYRPTFRKSGLAELTSFLEYTNVIDWHRRLTQAP